MKAAYIEDFNTWKEEFTFSRELPVRVFETDMFGHVNNTVVFQYFEYIRIEFMKESGLMERWTKEGSTTQPVVADIQCDYVRQVFFGETLTLYIKPHVIGNSSVDLHYKVENDKGEIVYVGRGALVQVNRETGRGEAWDEESREIFLSYGAKERK